MKTVKKIITALSMLLVITVSSTPINVYATAEENDNVLNITPRYTIIPVNKTTYLITSYEGSAYEAWIKTTGSINKVSNGIQSFDLNHSCTCSTSGASISSFSYTYNTSGSTLYVSFVVKFKAIKNGRTVYVTGSTTIGL